MPTERTANPTNPPKTPEEQLTTTRLFHTRFHRYTGKPHPNPPCRKYNNLDFRILRKTLEKQHNEGDSRSTCLTKTALPPVTQLFHIYTNHSQLPPIPPTIQVLPPKRRGRRSPRKTGIKQNTFPIFGTQNQWPFKINKVICPSVMTAQKLFRLRNQNFEYL